MNHCRTKAVLLAWHGREQRRCGALSGPVMIGLPHTDFAHHFLQSPQANGHMEEMAGILFHRSPSRRAVDQQIAKNGIDAHTAIEITLDMHEQFIGLEAKGKCGEVCDIVRRDVGGTAARPTDVQRCATSSSMIALDPQRP